jgi:hypothetical protein
MYIQYIQGFFQLRFYGVHHIYNAEPDAQNPQHAIAPVLLRCNALPATTERNQQAAAQPRTPAEHRPCGKLPQTNEGEDKYMQDIFRRVETWVVGQY